MGQNAVSDEETERFEGCSHGDPAPPDDGRKSGTRPSPLERLCRSADAAYEGPKSGGYRQLAVVLSGTLAVPLSVLSAGLVSGASGQAAATVGFVLAEALVLYVGYGALTRTASPVARRVIVGT
jgi:hypothetical protein